MKAISLNVHPGNCSFGSAPKEFWKHANFAKAWIDGRGTWQGQTMNYLHVPCHDEQGCDRCEHWGWETTVHRLWPKWWPYKMYCGPKNERPPYLIKSRGRRVEVTEVKLGKSDSAKYGWVWVLTVQPRALG